MRKPTAIERAADRYVLPMTDVILGAIGHARKQINLDALEEACRRADVGAALAAVEGAITGFRDALLEKPQTKAPGERLSEIPGGALPTVIGETMKAGAEAVEVCALGKPPIRQQVQWQGKPDDAKKRLLTLEVESQILDARARFEGLKNWQLNKLKLVNSAHLSLRTPGVSGSSKALGLYQDKGSKVTIAAKQELFHDPSPRVGQFVFDKGLAGTIRHELGHHIHLRHFAPKTTLTWDVSPMQEEWRGIANQYTAVDAIQRDPVSGNVMHVVKPAPTTTPISVYAKTNERELFAESWSLYDHPDYRQPGFPRLPGNIESFFDKWLKPKPNAWTPEP